MARRLIKAAEWLGIIRKQTEDGKEIVDNKPLAIPAGFRRPPTLQEQVARLVERDISARAAAVGEESWEEANDFDIDEDFDPSTPWESIYDHELGREVTPAEFKEHWPQIREEMQSKIRNYYRLQEQDELLRQVEDRIISSSSTQNGPSSNRGAGVSPAPSSDRAAKPPPAEQ